MGDTPTKGGWSRHAPSPGSGRLRALPSRSMAGNTVRSHAIGVGPALRRAREIGGTTVDEAARDTKLSVEQLEGLESEDFELLGEEVYVRAMLRTYAQYLGLKPDKVMAAYAKHVDDPEPPQPPAKMGRVEQALAAARIRDNQRFLLIAASVILLAAVCRHPPRGSASPSTRRGASTWPPRATAGSSRPSRSDLGSRSPSWRPTA